MGNNFEKNVCKYLLAWIFRCFLSELKSYFSTSSLPELIECQKYLQHVNILSYLNDAIMFTVCDKSIRTEGL